MSPASSLLRLAVSRASCADCTRDGHVWVFPLASSLVDDEQISARTEAAVGPSRIAELSEQLLQALTVEERAELDSLGGRRWLDRYHEEVCAFV